MARPLFPAAGLALALAGAAAAADVPCLAPEPHDLRPGPGVTRVTTLSEWLPLLEGTPGDTPVFVLEGREPGGTLVVASGTHENELAGVFAATLLVERARVAQGRLVVVPRANNSAVTWRDPEKPAPDEVVLASPSGPRRFRFGARTTNPAHQGAPDPPVFRHAGGGKELPGVEARNLDRAYPGAPAGTLTERVAFAIVELLRREKADLAFDLHEAGPGSRLAWMVVAHPRGIELAAEAVLDLDAAGLPMKLESSDDAFRGLSHREWGDATGALAFLVETPNPAQEKDAAAKGPVEQAEHPAFPLALRAGAHLRTLLAVLHAHAAQAPPERRVRLEEVPGTAELLERGVGSFLR